MRRIIAAAAIGALFTGSGVAAARILGSPARPAVPRTTAATTPSPAGHAWTSTEGDLALRYPNPWRVAEAGRNDGHPFESAILTSFTEEHARELMGDQEEGLVGDLYKIDVAIDAADGATIGSLAARCGRPPGEARLDCRNVSINGRTWVREELRENIYTPARVITITTVADRRIYSLVAFVPEGDHTAAGIAQVREIFGSLIVR